MKSHIKRLMSTFNSYTVKYINTVLIQLANVIMSSFHILNVSFFPLVVINKQDNEFGNRGKYMWWFYENHPPNYLLYETWDSESCCVLLRVQWRELRVIGLQERWWREIMDMKLIFSNIKFSCSIPPLSF